MSWRLCASTLSATFVVAGCLALGPSYTEAAARPNVEVAPFENLKLLSAPNHAWRHMAMALRGVRSLPAGGKIVEVDCAISRDRAGWALCRAPGSNYPIDCMALRSKICTLTPDPVTNPVLLAAAEIGGGYHFDPASLPGGPETLVHTRIAVKLDPSDLLALTPPSAATLVSMDAVNWQTRAVAYQERDRMLNFEGKVSVVCQIQTDGSLLCGDVKGAPRKGAFVGVPAELEELWHAAPQLLDGTPSAGRWVQIDLTFKLSPPGHG